MTAVEDTAPATVHIWDRDITPTREQLNEARGWVSDCQWREDEYGIDPAEEYADEEIVRGVDKHYAGGWDEFLVNSGFAEREPDVEVEP